VQVVEEPKPEVGEMEGKELAEIDLAKIKLNIQDDVESNYLLQTQEKLENVYKATCERIDELQGTKLPNSKTELYQLLGFYVVFQGVVFTAVAQSITLYCLSSWAPTSLSLLVSAITVVGVHNKLTDYSRLKVALQRLRMTKAVSFSKQIF
jgi:hypothetical protein